MRIVIVLRGDDLLIAADAKSVVDHRQPGRRVGREGDLRRRPAGVLGQRPLHRGEGTPLGIGECRDLDPHRVGVELLAEMVDRLGYRLRVGDKEEARQVRPVRREGKEVANRQPVGVPAQTVQWSRPGSRSIEAWDRREQRRRDERLQQLPAREHHFGFSLLSACHGCIAR